MRPANAASRPMPATVGGSTSGSSMSVIATVRPRKRRVPRKYAAGVPTSRITASAIAFVVAVSTSASRTAGSSSWSSRRCSGTRAKIATIGRTRKPSATSVTQNVPMPNAAPRARLM